MTLSRDAAQDVVRQSDALHAEVRAWIRGEAAGEIKDEKAFDELALRIARFQAQHVAPIARLYRNAGFSPNEVQSADAIRAVPCDVFRLARVCVHPPELDTEVFRTSGTSQGKAARGEHAFRVVDTYKAAALAWAKRMLFPDRSTMRTLLFAPPRSAAPDSSLSFMLDLFAAELGGPSVWALRNEALDFPAIEAFCEQARADGAPVLVLGTSFAFVHWLDARKVQARPCSLELPEGSRVMQTGGFKGRSRTVEAPLLRADIALCFGVPERYVIGEYGMTELSSQAYEGMLADALLGRAGAQPGVYFTPPWMRVSAADPETLKALPEGQIGIARIVDLANVDSAVAIQTSDLVRCEGDRVELLGRAPGALPRGCSIAADAMLDAAAR